MAIDSYSFAKNVPNMSAYELGYGLGYGVEKFGETVLLTRGVGFGMSTARYGLGEAMWRSSTFGPKSLLFGRYHSQFVPFGRRGILNTGMRNGVGWSNHNSSHVFRGKLNGYKFFEIYK